MDPSTTDPNNNNNNAGSTQSSSPLNSKSLGEELEETDTRSVLSGILSAVGQITRALTDQAARLDRLETAPSAALPSLPAPIVVPAPSVVRVAAVTDPPAAVTKRSDVGRLGFDEDVGSVSTPARWADRPDVGTPLVSEPRGAKQTEVASVDLKVDLDQTQPDKRLTLVNVVVRVGGVGRVGQVQPGVGDKLGEKPKASEILEALLGVCRVARQNGWGPELLCQWLQIHWAEFLVRDEVLLNLVREFQLASVFAHLGQFHFTDEALGSLILFVLGQLKPTEGETAAAFVSRVDRFGRYLYPKYFSMRALYITLVSRLESHVSPDNMHRFRLEMALTAMRSASNRYDIPHLLTLLSAVAVPILLHAGKKKGDQPPAKAEPANGGKKGKRGTNSPSQTPSAAPSTGGGGGGRGRGSGDSQGHGSASGFRGTCNRCGRQGHKAFECPNPPSGGGDGGGASGNAGGTATTSGDHAAPSSSAGSGQSAAGSGGGSGGGGGRGSGRGRGHVSGGVSAPVDPIEGSGGVSAPVDSSGPSD